MSMQQEKKFDNQKQNNQLEITYFLFMLFESYFKDIRIHYLLIETLQNKQIDNVRNQSVKYYFKVSDNNSVYYLIEKNKEFFLLTHRAGKKQEEKLTKNLIEKMLSLNLKKIMFEIIKKLIIVQFAKATYQIKDFSKYLNDEFFSIVYEEKIENTFDATTNQSNTTDNLENLTIDNFFQTIIDSIKIELSTKENLDTKNIQLFIKRISEKLKEKIKHIKKEETDNKEKKISVIPIVIVAGVIVAIIYCFLKYYKSSSQPADLIEKITT